MVVAYLQHLLPKNHHYGARSRASEEIILEALTANVLAQNMTVGVMADMAMIPALNEKGITRTAEVGSARLARAAELRSMDVYRVAEQLQSRLKCANTKNEVSLFQIYQIAEKTGIFDAFDEHYTSDKAIPLL